MLLAAALASAALAQPAPADRLDPIPTTTLTLAHTRMKASQGGQRVHVTIPVTPGIINEFGDSFVYRWNTGLGKPRCRPGPLPDLSAVTAGTVIDVPLPRPARSWCRGTYHVGLDAIVTINCAQGALDFCPDQPQTRQIADARFEVGSDPKSICHTLGDVQRCFFTATYSEPASWIVTAPLDDLLGPDGATSEADRYFERAFRHEPALRENWELDDNTFYGDPETRPQAIRMQRIVDRVLRAGPYHAQGPTPPTRSIE